MIWKRRHDTTEWLDRVLGPGAPEVSCEECFRVLDRYVDLELRGERDEGLMPAMDAHLRGCPACREEHDLLLAFAGERGR